MIGFASRHGTLRSLVALCALLLLLVFSTTIFAQGPAGDSGYVTLTGARLNVRSAPDAAAAVIGKLETNAAVTILGASDDGAWLHITSASFPGEGWASAAYIARGASAAPSSTSATASSATTGSVGAAATPSATTTASRGLTGAAGVVVVRANAKIASPTPDAPAFTLPTATPARVAILPTATPRATTVATVAAAAATSASTVAATEAATTASSTATATPTDAPTTDAPTTEAPITDAPTTGMGDPLATTRPASMNLRGGPGTNYNVIGSAPAGTILYITGVTQAGDWYRVNRADSTEAWVSATLVDLSGATESIAALSADELPEPPAAPAESPSVEPLVQAAAGAPVTVNAPAPSGFGAFGYGITASMWQNEKGSVANAIQDIGFNWVKQQVRWEFVENEPGAVNWSEMDAIVATMNGYGINVAFSVVTSPPWTRPTLGGTGGPPEDFQLFANFVGAIAGRYCGQSLHAIEVWNEQNLQREWEGLPLDPARYMDLLKRSYGAIKAACPSMLVISGATTPAGNSDVAVDDIDYLRGMYQNGLANFSDGIGIHPSGFANPPSARFSDWQSGSYNAESHVNHRSFYFLSTLEESRNVMLQFGDANKRLWPTEFGWGSAAQPYPGYEYQRRVTEQQQADWTTQAYQIMANSGYVGVAFLWNLNYNQGEMATFSILGRPAYQALKSMMGR